MSHSNGFPIPPEKFKLTHGRDYKIAKQLKKVIDKRSDISNVQLIKGVYNPWETKAILGKFDMVISGRIHAAVGAMSQRIPTVIMNYGHEPKAHKLLGFTKEIGMDHYLVDPSDREILINKIKECYENKEKIKNILNQNLINVIKKSRKNFTILKSLFN